MMISGKMTPCRSREAIVTVLDYRDGVMDGYLQHPRLTKKERIYSLTQMMLLLDSLLDLEDCPNSPPSFVFSADSIQNSTAVFHIQILFREHYTWQGRLVWKNEDQETVFSSELELMKLFDEVLHK